MKRVIKTALQEVFFKSSLYYTVANRNNQIFLTFDDGPNPECTPLILDTLKRFSVKAGFFQVGDYIARQPDLFQRVLEDGHLIGNHSQHHRGFSKLSLQRQLAEIDKTFELLNRHGVRERFFRPPQGRLSLSLLRALRKQAVVTVMWSYDSLDYQGTQAESLLNRLYAHDLKAGDILLFHEDSPATCEILENVIGHCLEKGLTFARLDEAVGSS